MPGAEAFLAESAASVIAAIADEACGGEASYGFLTGETREDSRGRYLVLTGVSEERTDSAVGWYRISESRGHIMSDADVKEHIDMFGGTPAVAVMADPKRSLFAAYVVKNGKSRTARVVVLEGVRPSNPDGVTVAHILLGRAQLPHEFGHHGVEEKKRGALENGTEGSFGSGRLPAPRTD